MPRQPFTFIDLFAGIGGIRYAFQELGGECVFTSEWDKHAQITYFANFGDMPEGDIAMIPTLKVPKHDILLAGFPCQPFSNAGLRKGFEDTRGTLFFEIARIIEFRKPKLVLLENVKGFVNHDKGNTFNTVKRVLEEQGYSVYHKVLNAKDFGVPQNRERVYIVAVKNTFSREAFIYPEPPKFKTSVGDILEKRVSSAYTISDRLWSGHQRRLKEHRLKGNGFGYGLFDRNSTHTNTISARYYKDGSEILIAQKDKNPRKLTPREAARLQGFPDDFVIPVSDTQAYRQFGNSVAIPVVAAVAKQMLKLLKN
jgi:DNA (cytosine-5)-methyltransferase 1